MINQKTSPGLTIREISEKYGHSEPTLRRYVAKGKLKAVRFGGRLYFDEDAVHEALAPVPARPSDDYLREWAQKQAAAAPPFRPEQRDIIVSAFSTIIKSKVA